MASALHQMTRYLSTDGLDLAEQTMTLGGQIVTI